MDISTFLEEIAIIAGNKSIYVVGGTIRDKLLNRVLTDYDFSCIEPLEIATQFSKSNGFYLVKLDDTPRRETFRVVSHNQTIFDFTALKGKSIEEDLARRDFTINSLAVPLDNFIKGDFFLIDPFGGQKDLTNKTVRVLPGNALKEDPLRVLRAFRFSAQLNFEIEPDTFSRLVVEKEGLNQVAGERITPELCSIFSSNNSLKTVMLMVESGLLDIFLPKSQNKNPKDFALKVYKETEFFLNNPESLYPDRFNQDGIFLKEPVKKFTKFSCFIWCFQKNNSIEIQKTEELLKKLRLSNSDSNFILKTIQTVNKALDSNLDFAGWSPNFSKIYNFVKQAGEELIPSLFLAAGAFKSHLDLNDIAGEGFVRATHNLVDFYCRRYLPAQKQPPLLTGDDLQNEFKLTPSPVFKSILEYIEEGRVLGTIKTKEVAKKMVKSMVESF